MIGYFAVEIANIGGFCQGGDHLTTGLDQLVSICQTGVGLSVTRWGVALHMTEERYKVRLYLYPGKDTAGLDLNPDRPATGVTVEGYSGVRDVKRWGGVRERLDARTG